MLLAKFCNSNGYEGTVMGLRIKYFSDYRSKSLEKDKSNRKWRAEERLRFSSLSFSFFALEKL